MAQIPMGLGSIMQTNISHGMGEAPVGFRATYDSCCRDMGAPSLAWGKCHLFGLPDGSHVYGREFELLPAGTMFAAAVIMHGIIGATAVVGKDSIARIPHDAKLRILPTRNTDAAELSIYADDISEAYRVQELQDAQG
jgi:hypothetical protein